VNVDFVETEEELRAVYPVMRLLRPNFDEAAFCEYARDAIFPAGATMVAAFDCENVVAAATFRISASLAWGKYLYVDDLVTREEDRSSGYGARLLEWLSKYGRQNGCQDIHLDSGVQRHDAHRFYLRERMDIVFYHFRKPIA
jgi:GNAT superfamily N-acetyltransferase